jgi:hypothetical protein
MLKKRRKIRRPQIKTREKRQAIDFTSRFSFFACAFFYGLALGSAPDEPEPDCAGLALFVPAGVLIKTAIRMLAITIKTTVAPSIKNVALEIGFGVELKDFSSAVAVSPRLTDLSAIELFPPC